jgi:hypothetical protein
MGVHVAFVKRQIVKSKGMLCLVVALLLTIPVSCKDIEDVYTPKEWLEIFEKAGGWTPLPFPDSKYRPGSIISVTENGIRWIDNLDACGFPIAEFGQPSYIPAIIFEKAWEFNGSALINFKGISAGPGFNRISKIRMEIEDYGADAFRLLRLRVWLEDPDNRAKVSQVCMDELKKNDTYLITEAFRVSSGKYMLFDETGVSIKLETPVLKHLLQFQPDVKYAIATDGSLIIEQPAIFAVRRAQRVDDGFITLGPPDKEPETADDKIEQLFINEHPIE